MKIDSKHLENLSTRLNYALQLTGTKKADLARAISVKPQVIQFLCSSNTQASRFTFEISTVLGLNTRWLATGDGAMFIADDPKQQFLKIYKKIPLLTVENLKNIFLSGDPLNEDTVNVWLPLKTEDKNIFAIKMMDNSMEPYLPFKSVLFIKQCEKKACIENNYVFAYLKKFDTFVVRQITNIDIRQFLVPKNIELYKEITINDDVSLIGLVTDCFWHIRS